jgi:hypothetical protein
LNTLLSLVEVAAVVEMVEVEVLVVTGHQLLVKVQVVALLLKRHLD